MHIGPLKNPVVVADPAPPSMSDRSSKPRVGTRTLSQESQAANEARAPAAVIPDAPAAPTVPTGPAPVELDFAAKQRIEWIKQLVKVTVVPVLETAITASVVAAAPALAGPAVAAGKTLVQPTMDWLVDQLASIVTDPAAFSDAAKRAVTAAWDNPGEVVAAARARVIALVPSRDVIGRGVRGAVIAGSQLVGQKLLESVAGRLAGYPAFSSLFSGIAPGFGRLFGYVVDIGIDSALPMVVVARADAPVAGEIIAVCSIFPAAVEGEPTVGFDGYYRAAVRFSDTRLDWLTIAGTAALYTGPEKRIASLVDPTQLVLRFGPAARAYVVSVDAATYGEHDGLAVTGKIVSPHGVGATLGKLSISPMGWVEGSFVEGGKPGRLGGTAPGGVAGPTPAASASVSASAPAPRPAAPAATPKLGDDEREREPDGPKRPVPSSEDGLMSLLGRDPSPIVSKQPLAAAEATMVHHDDLPELEADPDLDTGPDDSFGLPPADGSSLATGIDQVLRAEQRRWLLTAALRIGGFLTGHRNLAPGRKPRPASARPPFMAAPREPKARMSAWLAAIDPGGMLDAMSHASLVPAWLQTSYPRMSLVANELKIGREPSISFGMTTSLTLFARMPTISANNVVVVWLPNASPSVRLRADDVSFGDNLWVRGLEVGSDGGVRAVKAGVGIPLPFGEFSVSRLQAEADYLTVGRGVGFRKATAAAHGLSIARTITIENVEVSATEDTGDPRFSGKIEGGKARLAGVDLAFAGSVDWGGGRPMTGKGAVSGGPLSALDGALTVKRLEGSVEVGPLDTTGRVAATDLAVKWNAYDLQVSGDVALDRRGVAGFEIPSMKVSKGGQPLGSAIGVTYLRDKQLTVASLVLTVPAEGPVRGVAEDKTKPAELSLHNVDLSVVTRTPAAQAKPPKSPAASLSAKNLAKLELGPSGAAPLLALDFTKAARDALDAPPAPRGALAAVVSGDLRAFELKPTVIQVSPSENGDGVRLAIGPLSGTGYALEQLVYDDGILDVKGARVSFQRLLGDQVPEALTGFLPDVTASFEIDTAGGKLQRLAITGELAGGTLFGGALTVKGAQAKLDAVAAALPRGALTNGLTLQGDITVAKATLGAYGVRVDLHGGIKFPSGAVALSGVGEGGPVKVDVVGARFGDGPTTFDRANVEIGAPANNLVKFLASPSNDPELTDELRARVVIKAVRVAIDASGAPIAAGSEEVSVVPAPRAERAAEPAAAAARPVAESPQPAIAATDAATTAPAAPRFRTKLDVHLPTIDIGDGAVVLTASDVHIPAGDGVAKVTTAVSAAINVGPLNSVIKGRVTMRLPRRDDQPVDGSQVAADPHATSVELWVESATLNGITATGLGYAAGKLTIDQATAPLSLLLAGLPEELGLSEKRCSLTGVVIDLNDKKISAAGIAMSATDLAFLGGDATIAQATATLATTKAELTKAALVHEHWGLTLNATTCKLKIVDGLSVGGSAQVALDKHGFSNAEISDAKVAWGNGAAGVTKAAFTKDSFSLDGLFVTLGPKASKLGFDLAGGGLPTWMPLTDDWAVRATLLNLSRDKGQPTPAWPGLAAIKLDVIAAGLKLGGITGWFDRDKKKARLKATPPAGELSAAVQLPIAQGVGLEIVGSLGQQFKLDTEVNLADGDDVAISGAVTAGLKLSGRLRVGIFGGVPYLFTVSAGVYGGIDFNAPIQAVASGRWQTPKTGADKPNSHLELYLKVADEAGKPAAITGEAGMYAAVKVLGYYKALEKPLAKVVLASLDAHGYVRMGTGTGLTLLPEGGFPRHLLYLHPTLEQLLFDTDTQKALKEAQRNVDRGVAKVEASEELIDQKPPASSGDKPWQGQKAGLQAVATQAGKDVKDDKTYVDEVTAILRSDRSWLDQARTKLAHYQDQILILELPPDEAGAKFGYTKGSDGVVRTAGRAARAGTVADRLAADYGKWQGLVEERSMLDAAQTRLKIAHKQEEIAAIERRIALDITAQSEKRLKQARDTDKETKAQRKAELADQTRGNVDLDHEKRQDRLLALYAKLEEAHAQAHRSSSRRTEQKAKIAGDKQEAIAQLAAIVKRGDASPAERMFWEEQVKYVTAEEARLTEQAKVPPLTVSDDAKRAIDRAKQERGVAQREPLDGAATAALEAVQREIEAITVGLSQNFRALATLRDVPASAPDRTRLEAERDQLLVKLDAAQERAKDAFEQASA